MFAARVNVSDGTVTPVALPEAVTEFRWGMTGMARYRGGYACLLPPSSLVLLSASLEVEALYDLKLVLDPHSIASHDGKLYLASTGTDSIVEFTPEDGEKVFWRASDTGTDTVHLNSILWRNDGLWITAFGKKGGALWRSAEQGYALNILSGARAFGHLHHPHSLIEAGGSMWVCESATMTIRSSQGLQLTARHGYLRGLTLAGGFLCVGSTKGRTRSKSTGSVIGNSADPGQPAGDPGIAVYELENNGVTAREPQFRRFIELGAYADEIYDILPINSPN
ncbi:MAG TPA: DUF4915 domain-containing protein [Bryobacteraceae bacterium]